MKKSSEETIGGGVYVVAEFRVMRKSKKGAKVSKMRTSVCERARARVWSRSRVGEGGGMGCKRVQAFEVCVVVCFDVVKRGTGERVNEWEWVRCVNQEY